MEHQNTSAVLLADVMIEISNRVSGLKDLVQLEENRAKNAERELAVAMESVKATRESHLKIATQYETAIVYKNELINQIANRDATIKELHEQLGHRENERDEAVQRLNDLDKKSFKDNNLKDREIKRLKKDLEREAKRSNRNFDKMTSALDTVKMHVDTITELRKEIAKLKKA